MDILFTGATSLAARELVPLLRESGHNVLCVSRKPLFNCDSVVVDLGAEGSETLLPNRTFDALIHFASYVPLQERASTWEQCSPVNIGGTTRLLKWAEHKVGRILLASSCAVYGAQPSDAPILETAPVIPDTHYAVTKYAQEQLVSAFCIPRSIPYASMRLGYVYGPGIPEERAVAKFISAVRSGKAITLRNATSAGLPLVHTRDIADISLRLLLNGDGIYNVVSDEFVSLRDFVEAIMRVCDKSVEIVQQNDPATPRTAWYSLQRLKSEGMHSTIGIEAGIRTLVLEEANSCPA